MVGRGGVQISQEERLVGWLLVGAEETPSGGLGTDISSLFVRTGLSSDVPELRGQPSRVGKFESCGKVIC
jgi:hypothetical protein